jgi:hypothetical protein
MKNLTKSLKTIFFNELAYIQELKQKTFTSQVLLPALFRVKHKEGHYIWLEGTLNNMFQDKDLNGYSCKPKGCNKKELKQI